VPKIRVAVLDTGPLIHLGEVGFSRALNVVEKIVLSDEVIHEFGVGSPLPKNAIRRDLEKVSKDLATLLMEEFGIGPGEATAIALARQEGIRLLFTDDLDAREVAHQYGLEPHGTLAMVVRAFRENVLSKGDAIKCVEKLRSASTLYLTSDLVRWTRKQIEEHGQ
jgi:hypothetical protein